MKSGRFSVKSLPVMAAAFWVCLNWLGCEVPSSAKSPGGGGNEQNNKKYPCISAVEAEAEDLVYEYNSPILFEKFKVYYQESEEVEPVLLEPATETTEGFMINGKKSSSDESAYVKAGKPRADAPGKYGDFALTFTSSEDPSAVSLEFKVFVVATEVSPGDSPLKLEIVREPFQTVYDRGEPFLATGMIVVAWYNEETAGETVDSGGKPLQIHGADLVIDDTALRSAKNPGANIDVKITYTQGTTPYVTNFRPTLQIKQHQITKAATAGVTYQAVGTAPTGAYVTIGVKTDEDYEMLENGLSVEYLNKDGAPIGEVGFSEIAPNGDYRRFVFEMPRYPVKIAADVSQKASGLGSLQYKIDEGGTYKDVPGFANSAHHLQQQIAITSEQGTSDHPLYIKAGPPDDLQGGSVVITIYANANSSIIGPAATTEGADTPVVQKFSETSGITNIQAGNTLYTISVLYTTANGLATPRQYTLQVMKEDEQASIKYTYTGSYQVFSPTRAGRYKIEAWGANGGDAPYADVAPETRYASGGKGGYAAGTIALDPNSTDANKKMLLYIYVGGKGVNHNTAAGQYYVPGAGGWNGGGRGGASGSRAGAGGGGATSISVVAGAWNDVDVLGNRILVAGGGGGASPWGKAGGSHSNMIAGPVNGSVGGGLYGSPANTKLNRKYGPYSAYKRNAVTGNEDLNAEAWPFPDGSLIPGQSTPPVGDPTAGFNGQGFGQGGYGRDGDSPNIYTGDGYNGKGGGGGGWWGGRVSTYRGSDANASDAGAGGGGGSNYISGHDGCIGVSSVKNEENQTTFENTLTIISKGNSVYFGSTAGDGQPTAGSPAVGIVAFTDTVMNASFGNTYPDTPCEADPDDANLNNKSYNGNGWVTITYLGGL